MKTLHILCLALMMSAGCLHALTPYIPHVEENGLACKLIIPKPYRVRVNGMEIQFVLKNISQAPIRVCTVQAGFGEVAKDWADTVIDPEFHGGAVPANIDDAVDFVSIPPGASLILSSDCPFALESPFRVTASYGLSPVFAKLHHTWQGLI